MHPTGRLLRTVLSISLGGFALFLAGPQAEAQEPSTRTSVDPTDFPEVSQDFLNGLTWRNIGPFRGGRVTAVGGDVTDPLVFYHGAAHGGVWKTTDAGISWQNISDEYFAVSNIGAMSVSRSDPDVIYVGTGEGIPRQHISIGRGVYKSTDGGDTWSHVGLDNTRHISKMVVHPTNPDIVFVAAKGDMFGPDSIRGVYRTTDGGRNWEKVLYVNDHAGAVDITMDMSNPDVVIASLNYHIRYLYDEVSGGPGSGLYKTSDGGDTWVNITRNEGMPDGVVGKIGVSISQADPRRVYAIVEAAEGGVYRSDDGGESWQQASADRTRRLFPASYNHITADTQDPDVVYLQHQRFWRSTDGGRTFNQVSMDHADHHALWIDPNDSDRMIDGGDGGAAVTLNGGASWSSLENQSTADLFSLAVDDQEPYWVYASQNDNGHIAIPSQTNDATIGWEHYLIIPMGEGGETAVKPDGSVVYACDRTAMVRYDRTSNQAPNISVWPEDEFGEPIKDVTYRFYYSFPVYVSPHDPGTLYTGAQYLFRSKTEGSSWDQISPDLTKNRQDVMGKIPGGPITSIASSLYYVSLIRAIAESPIEEGELWVGTDDSMVQISRNGGENWTDVSPDLPEWTTITAIDVSRHRPGTAYISGERHRVSDRTPYLFKTTDYGQTWQRITNGIREYDYSWVIREDPVRPGLLYAGTETGVYVSFDDGAFWQPLQRNLPPIEVMNMVVKEDDLVASTHSRGFWILDNLSPLRQITPEVAAASVHLFSPAPLLRNLGRRLGPAVETATEGMNPPNGLTIDYYLASPSSEVTIAILEEDGDVIQEYSGEEVPGDRGMNRFLWDLRYPAARRAPAEGPLTSFEASQPVPPVAPPGVYRVRLTVDGIVREETAEIRIHPRVPASADDLQAQFELMTKIRDRTSEAADAVIRIRQAQSELESRSEGVGATEQSSLRRMHEDLQVIKGQLTRLMGSNPMELHPKGLINKLAGLSRAVLEADARPTQQMFDVFEDLADRLDVQLEAMNAILDEMEGR